MVEDGAVNIKHENNTSAVILAAGLGRRMQPLSNRQHKALLPIGEVKVLSRIIDSILANNISNITIVTGVSIG
jgi:glucose-1-phosphate thymidylyltransferase